MKIQEHPVPSSTHPILDHPHFRQAVKFLCDGLLAGLAWLVAELLWFDSRWHPKRMVVWVLFSLAVDGLFRLTRQHYRMTSYRDALRLGGATTVLVLASFMIDLPINPVPMLPQVAHIAFASSVLTGLLWGLFRVACRARHEALRQRHFVGGPNEHPLYRTLIVGAGRAGSLVAEELRRHAELGYSVIGFVDDAPQKRSVDVQGIPVLGGSRQLPAIVAEHHITHAVLAIPSASGQVVRELHKVFEKAGVQVKTVPGLFNLLGTQTWKPVLRDVTIEDLLHREPIRLDHSALIREVRDAVVLITGAGGSIGSELARQVAVFKPKKIVLLGRGENSLWMIQREFERVFPDQQVSMVLMDIRNQAGLLEAFEEHRPNVVLHAAAHKHVPFLEIHPLEAVHNNVFGTWNVVQAALASGTRVLVNISTDKAVNPTNVLGASKRIAECIVLAASRKAAPGCRFVNVRFGNVLGSRGSVVPVFREQIQRGGPITVTHPEMTRYFMTIPEASQLVLQAGLLGASGKVYLLDMGEPVKILDMATDMARLSGLTPGKDIQIEFVGLRPGEKLYEEMFLERESSGATDVHPKVFEAALQEMDPAVLEKGLDQLRKAMQLPFEQRQPEIVRLLKELVPTYTPSPLGVGKFGGHVRDRRKVARPLPSNVVDRRKTTSSNN